MPMQVPDYIQSLVPYVPGKPIAETQREFKLKRVIKLASNENPLGASPRAIRAVRGGLADLHRYPDASAFELKRALARFLDQIEPSEIIIGNGSNEIIDFLIRTYCLAGDSILTSRAAFIAYKICAQIHGVNTIETPLDSELCADLGQMLIAVRDNPKVKLVFLANPNNPTGTSVSDLHLRQFLTEVAKLRSAGVLVVLDYAYWEYVTSRSLSDPLTLMRDFSNVVVLRTFSKVYGLAGLRIGYAIGPHEIIQSLEKVRQPFNVSSLALVAAQQALLDRSFVSKSKKLNKKALQFWEESLDRLKVPYWKSQGNFMLIDTERGFGKPGLDVYLSCLKKGVILRPVANYGLHHALRISMGTMSENRLALRALQSLRES